MGFELGLVGFDGQGVDQPPAGLGVGEDAHDVVRRLISSLRRSGMFVTGMRKAAPKTRLRAMSLRRAVRPSGTEAPGARKCRQADQLFEPRARVRSAPSFRSAQRQPSGPPRPAARSPATRIIKAAREAGAAALKANADRHAANVLPIIEEIRKSGATTLRAIAEALNARGVSTPRGKRWEAASIRNALARG